MNIGFIGYGSMGRMLVKGLINSAGISQEQLIITRKNKEKFSEIKSDWSGVETTTDAGEVARKSHLIFICIKAHQYLDILNEIKPFITPDKHIISTAGSVSIKNIESFAKCKVTKLMPTILSEVNEGISLICHNSKVSDEDAELVQSLIKHFSTIKITDEKDFAFATELTSCGPGLLTAILKEFTEAALRHNSTVNQEETADMILHTLTGTIRLALEKSMTFDDVVSRVATKGGITEEGVKVVESGLPKVFDEMFGQTTKKRLLVEDKIEKSFAEYNS